MTQLKGLFDLKSICPKQVVATGTLEIRAHAVIISIYHFWSICLETYPSW